MPLKAVVRQTAQTTKVRVMMMPQQEVDIPGFRYEI